MTALPDDLGDLVPDRIPQWLTDMVNRSKGRNMNDFSLLDEFYKETQVVKADRWDSHHYRKMRKDAEELKELSQSRFTDDPTWYELIQDEYLGLYKSRPETRDKAEMKPTHQLNHAVMDKVANMKDWSELRTYTELDQWSAAMAAVEFGVKLGELFDEMKELQEAQKKLNDADSKVKQLLEQLNELGPDGEMSKAEELLDDLQEALDDFGEAAGGAGQQIEQHQNGIRQAAKEAAKEAHDDASQVMDMLESFGTEPGALKRMPSEARLELARRIQRNRKLKELAEKVGRFVRLALGEQARKIIHGTDELHDIEMGQEIHRTLPSELVKLSHPAMKKDFFRKYAERELLQYELRGTEKVARGAIVCMIDSSGSMMGSKETWAKAVAIALLNIANKQNRDFYGIIFSSARDPLKEWYFKKGKAEPKNVLDFAEFEYHGGTDFMKPLGRGVEILEKMFNDDGAQKGDLVLITDGICHVSDEWLERYMNSKRELAFRNYSCLIGTHAPILDVLSDQVYNITDLAQGDDVREIFGYV